MYVDFLLNRSLHGDDARPHLIPFPTSVPPAVDEGPDLDQPITLPCFYDQWILPQVQHQRPGSRKEQRTALRHWTRIVGDVDIRRVNRQTLEQFRDVLRIGRSPATVNKTWRQLRMFFTVARDMNVIQRIPQVGLGMKCRLMDERPKLQREPITNDEVERLWQACSHATYPAKSVWPAPILWRVALLMFYVYGPRTRDVFGLQWDNVRFGERVIRFQAMKTRKLQALPLIAQVDRHLKAIAGRSNFVFPGFQTRGHKWRGGKNRGALKSGYNATWRHEICAAANVDPPVTLKNFRETMVSRYNRIEPGLGAWIAGHFVPGVTAQHYDMPTHRIWDALESTPLPDCFSLDVL